MIDIGINGYSIISGQQQADQEAERPVLPLLGERPIDYRGLLPAANIDPDNYLRCGAEARQAIINHGVENYLQRIGAGFSAEQRLDPLVVAPIIGELSLLIGSQDPYSQAAAESLVQLAPYLGDSRGPWDQGRNLARIRLTIILNTLVGQLLPLVKSYCPAPRIKLGRGPQIKDLDNSREISAYVEKLYRNLQPGGSRHLGARGSAADAEQGGAVFQYSGWLAVLDQGLMNLAAFTQGGYKRSFPSKAMIAILNHCYQQHDSQYWRQHEKQFFTALQQLFQRLMITLARLGANWPSIDAYQPGGREPQIPVG